MKKLILLFTSYGPYHLARYQAAHEKAQNMGWEVIPLELARQEQAYSWQRQSEQFLLHSITTEGILEQQSDWVISLSLWKTLNQLQPHALAIAGYHPAPMLTALVWGRWHQRGCILMSDSKADDSPRSSFLEYLKTHILQQFQSALVAGSPHEDYLRKLGFTKPIWQGYDVIDNERFSPQNNSSLPRPMPSPFFLTVSRFLPRKNLLGLLSAYQAYRDRAPDPWLLIICGDGPQADQLQSHIRNLGLDPYVYMPGFLQESELLAYYTHANAFIQPSLQDQWGLVVNEAMAAGLPVLVSRRIGCFPDLIQEGITGLGFDPENVDELVKGMVHLSRDPDLCSRLGNAARKAISSWSLKLFATNLLAAAEAIS